jgi:hypothetical protein
MTAVVGILDPSMAEDLSEGSRGPNRQSPRSKATVLLGKGSSILSQVEDQNGPGWGSPDPKSGHELPTAGGRPDGRFAVEDAQLWPGPGLSQEEKLEPEVPPLA